MKLCNAALFEMLWNYVSEAEDLARIPRDKVETYGSLWQDNIYKAILKTWVRYLYG